MDFLEQSGYRLSPDIFTRAFFAQEDWKLSVSLITQEIELEHMPYEQYLDINPTDCRSRC